MKFEFEHMCTGSKKKKVKHACEGQSQGKTLRVKGCCLPSLKLTCLPPENRAPPGFLEIPNLNNPAFLGAKSVRFREFFSRQFDGSAGVGG